MIIVSPTSGSDAVSAKLEKVLKDGKASEVKVNNLGKKQLAYPIKKYVEAEYLVVNFEAPGEIVKEISEMLKVEQEMVLRHMVTKIKNVKFRSKSKAKKADTVAPAEVEKPAAKVTVRTKTSPEGKKVTSRSKSDKKEKVKTS